MKILIIVLNVSEPVEKADLGILFKGLQKVNLYHCVSYTELLICRIIMERWDSVGATAERET